MEKGYKKLVVWQKADRFVFELYKETVRFPKEEMYGLTSQLRRAAISIPCNIVEGMGRQGKNETKQFINIALGSMAEVEYLLEFSMRLKYLEDQTYLNLENMRKEIGSLLWRLYQSF